MGVLGGGLGLLRWEDEIAKCGDIFLVFVFRNEIQRIVCFFFNGSSISTTTGAPDFLQGLDESAPDVNKILVEPDLLEKVRAEMFPAILSGNGQFEPIPLPLNCVGA